MQQKINNLVGNFETEIKNLKESILNKDKDINTLKSQLEENKNRIAHLQTDVKLKAQEL